MSHTFTPPTNGMFTPTVLPSTPEWQMSPAKFFTPSIPKPLNVWVWSTGLVSTTQPPLWEFDANNPSVAYVSQVFYGGHLYDVDDTTAAILTGAGYVLDTMADPVGFGQGGYGGGGYGL